MKFGKRQVVLAALVLALGAAVYLNWQFSDNNDLLATNVVQSTKELGEAKYVNTAAKSSSQDKTDEKSDSDVQTISEKANEYFAKATASRQKARDEASDMIKEILNDVKSSDEVKAEAVKKAAETAQIIQQETNIENLVKSKGFSDCIAFIQNGECSIVVSADGLDSNSAITIKDIVSGQSGISFDKIKITEAKA